MKVPKHHYSRFLISVQFDDGFLPETLAGKTDYALNFLEDLGELARKSGKRLYATYSIVRGVSGYHAHFGVSWLPRHGVVRRISRYPISAMLEQCFFYMDNDLEGIKKITHDTRFVTDYILNQPKDGQSTIASGFYVHPDFVPVYSETKLKSYCSKRQFCSFKKTPQSQTPNRNYLLFLISVISIILISYLTPLLF